MKWMPAVTMKSLPPPGTGIGIAFVNFWKRVRMCEAVIVLDRTHCFSPF